MEITYESVLPDLQIAVTEKNSWLLTHYEKEICFFHPYF